MRVRLKIQMQLRGYLVVLTLDFLPWHFAGATFWRRGGQFGVVMQELKAAERGGLVF